MAFRLDPPAKNKWYFVFNRQIFPRLEIRGFVSEASRLKKKNGVRLVDCEAAHLFHSPRIYGRPLDLYLSLKLSELRRRKVQAVSPADGFTAALGLRTAFKDVWSKARPDDNTPRWLSFWPSRVQRFVAVHDGLVAASLDTSEVRTLFNKVGLDPNAWFAHYRSRPFGGSDRDL